MKHISLFILLILSACALAQTTYEKGYYIDNYNNKIDCYIKNYDWGNNPEEIEYKLVENAQSQTIRIDSIKEFGINDFSKYIRSKVKIDRSSQHLANLTSNSDPEWSEETIFLKTIIQGKATLFYYENHVVTCFFYSVNDSAIQQLIHKDYLTKGNEIATNNIFRAQLWADVRYEGETVKDIEHIDYNINTLKSYFIKYNQNSGQSYIEFRKKKHGEYFSLAIVPGLNSSTLYVDNKLSDGRDVDFGDKLSFSIGLEAKFALPFNKKKWQIILSPRYQNYKATGENNVGEIIMTYYSLEFELGLRYNMILAKDLQVFLNAFYLPGASFNFNSKMDYSCECALPLDPLSSSNSAFGGGIKYSRFNLEIRYYTNRNIFNNYQYWSTHYTKIGLLVGYTLF